MNSYGSLQEQEQRLISLERQNFDLKMQVYYLNQKVAAPNPDQSGLNSTPVPNSNFTEISILKDQNIESLRKIDELESEIIHLKAHMTDLAVPSETKPKHREAMAANIIAENDTIVINQLESEIEKLKTQHLKDISLLENCYDRVDKLTADKETLKGQITYEKGRNLRLQQKISLLVDRLKKEILFQRKDNSKSVEEQLEIFLVGITEPVADSVANLEATNLSVSGPQASDALVILPASAATQSNVTASNSELVAEPVHFLDFGSRSAWSELHSLRKECKELKQQIRNERELYKSQEEALKLLQKSYGEVSKMESTEIHRLELEIEKSLLQSEKWEKKFKRLEKAYLALRNESNSGLGEDKLAAVDTWDGTGQNRSPNAKIFTFDVGLDSVPKKEHVKIVDMYRKRETELLQVLEGMVTKCRELEKARTQPKKKT